MRSRLVVTAVVTIRARVMMAMVALTVRAAPDQARAVAHRGGCCSSRSEKLGSVREKPGDQFMFLHAVAIGDTGSRELVFEL